MGLTRLSHYHDKGSITVFFKIMHELFAELSSFWIVLVIPNLVIPNFCNPEFPSLILVTSLTSNITFLSDWAQTSHLDFGLIRQNISIKKASFQYQGCPLSLKSCNLWLNSYRHWISITSSWFYSQQFSLPYSKNILSVWSFRGDKKKKKKVFVNPTEFFQ